MVKSYFCKECCERHQISSKLYKSHKEYSIDKGGSGLRDVELTRIFKLDKILNNDALFKKLLKIS